MLLGFMFFKFIFMCVKLCEITCPTCACVPTGVLDTLELGSITSGQHCVWMLATEPRSFRRAIGTPDCISPDPAAVALIIRLELVRSLP